MPHKRAKRSVREQTRAQAGADLPPRRSSYSDEPVPKSVARVLNAAHIREEWKARKRSAGEELGVKGGAQKKRKIDGSSEVKTDKRKMGDTKAPRIQPGETLGHFNRRVESDMAPLLKSAMHTSSAHARKTRKAEVEARVKKKNQKPELTADRAPTPPPTPTLAVVKEFGTAAPRRLHDVAQAPPELKRLPRGARTGETVGKGSGLSMAQRAAMEAEREGAIKRYREMKDKRRREAEDGGLGAEKGG